MKNIIIILLILLALYLFIGCSNINKQVDENKSNFIIVISNQSIDIPLVDINLYIDGQLFIKDKFKVENQHNYKFYYYNLDPGLYEIKIESEKGEVTISEKFELQDEKLWTYIDYTYSNGILNPPSQPRLSIKQSNKPLPIM